jgi:hypothetical protein
VARPANEQPRQELVEAIRTPTNGIQLPTNMQDVPNCQGVDHSGDANDPSSKSISCCVNATAFEAKSDIRPVPDVSQGICDFGGIVPSYLDAVDVCRSLPGFLFRTQPISLCYIASLPHGWGEETCSRLLHGSLLPEDMSCELFLVRAAYSATSCAREG